ncbi:hypothetical protein MVLG_01214 [Microbotryum lychnidis-dioicae p1A1 Lamole]|uniref:SprT-like domain-containing protein n=1 Tax=Microbotryum lychnidis-dioicae (strain p1A1 Lamole / MvSl-1064) TaxID=683840 RepID=U5H1F8_USTV1|nr:hypothetical protein MVLG_01214 [Microbotryum lychnidis-dioicae p1A1 Lamole]|eukprot:KDE08761.1 hypothetical protein MVLG_01214 [Microbotryum lychnidis-dioicae p1A1 Lamole]
MNCTNSDTAVRTSITSKAISDSSGKLLDQFTCSTDCGSSSSSRSGSLDVGVGSGHSTPTPPPTGSIQFHRRDPSPKAVRRSPRLRALSGTEISSSPTSIPDSQEAVPNSVTHGNGSAPSLADLLFPPSPPNTQGIDNKGENGLAELFSKEGPSYPANIDSSNIKVSSNKAPSAPTSRRCSSPIGEKSRVETVSKNEPFTIYTLDDSSDEEDHTKDDHAPPITQGLGRLTIRETPKKVPRLPLSQTPSTREVRSVRRQGASTSPVDVHRSDVSLSRHGRLLAESKKPGIEVLVLSDSDSANSTSEEVERSVELGLEVEEPESEFDPDAGVISFIPTRTPSRPKKLSTTLISTPAPKSNAKGQKSIRQAEMDLTTTMCSSDEEGDGEEDLPTRFRNKTPLSQYLTPSTPRSSKSADKTAKSTPRRAATNLLTAKQRDRLPFELIAELNQSVFSRYYSSATSIRPSFGESAVSSSTASRGLPADVDIIWNKKLLKTAGRASWKRTKTSTTKDGDRADRASHPVEQISSIELSVKVVDSVMKLNNTLAHELCHLAAWVISNELSPPHGKAFKLWAARVMAARPDIEVTTTHSYQITYKYRWRCLSLDCQKIFQRHSRSIDTMTHGCPCGSRLVEIDADGHEKGALGGMRRTPAKKTAWQNYLAAMSPRVRQESPGIKQDEVFKRVAEMWKEEKENAAAALDKSMQQLEIG